MYVTFCALMIDEIYICISFVILKNNGVDINSTRSTVCLTNDILFAVTIIIRLVTFIFSSNVNRSTLSFPEGTRKPKEEYVIDANTPNAKIF